MNKIVAASEATTFAGDVQQKSVNEEMVQLALTKYGRLDVFVANAGIDWVDTIEETEEQVDNVFNINLKSHKSELYKRHRLLCVRMVSKAVQLYWLYQLRGWKVLRC